jgi:hypothetical protein
MPVNNLIQIRKGTDTSWTSTNPVLASGEPGYDLTNKIFKIGDGISVWTQLSGVNQNIVAGYDISITNNSGIYTIASTNLVHADSQQPQGFVNRTDSRISVSGNIFTIEPTGSSYSYYNKGIKVVKTSGDSLTIPNLTQINYIHFDTNNNQLSNKTTDFDFSTDIPISYIAWNSGVGPSGQMTFFSEERHGIVMDTSTHKWIHSTFGAQYVNGLSIGNYVLGGDGSSNSHATISISNGTLYQEDIEINITDSSSTDPFCQELSPIAQIPVYYHEGSTGQWVKNTATDYPVKYDANGPQYNLLTDGTWTIPDVSPGGATRYFAVWILATNQIDDPIISIMGQRVDSNQGSAESHNSWSDVNLTNLPLSEVKPLYRLIFAGDSDYTNVPKCTLLSILDIRVSVISTIAGVTQNDHGSLFGLGDDDHSQYLHVDNNRTVNAIHNFVNGLTSNGLINSTSGNFTQSLQVNGTGVSISGHSHVSTDISDSTTAGRALLTGVDASAQRTSLGLGTIATLSSGTYALAAHTHTSSDITDFNSSVSGLINVKNITAGTGIFISAVNGSYTINATGTTGGGGGGGGLNNVIEDTSPQLGGNLELNNYSVSGVGSLNISDTIVANSTGILLGNNGYVSQSGQTVLSQGYFNSTGDAQFSQYLLKATTTNSSWTPLKNNNTNAILLTNNRTYSFTNNIVARSSTTSSNAAYKLEGLLIHDASGIQILGTPIKTIIGEDDTSWDARVSISGAGVGGTNYLLTEVSGSNSHTINWLAKVDLLEVGTSSVVTPTPTPTQTVTPTQTATPTVTPTRTYTPTPSPTSAPYGG